LWSEKIQEIPREAKKPRSQTETIPTGSEWVLLVEYEQGLRTAVREFLRSTGYTVPGASNGMEALQISEGYQGRIDLLLSDYACPGLARPAWAPLR
jgi:DNA-binding NtrC family response regulator